jgi:hypothetical protein
LRLESGQQDRAPIPYSHHAGICTVECTEFRRRESSDRTRYRIYQHSMYIPYVYKVTFQSTESHRAHTLRAHRYTAYTARVVGCVGGRPAPARRSRSLLSGVPPPPTPEPRAVLDISIRYCSCNSIVDSRHRAPPPASPSSATRGEEGEVQRPACGCGPSAPRPRASRCAVRLPRLTRHPLTPQTIRASVTIFFFIMRRSGYRSEARAKDPSSALPRFASLGPPLPSRLCSALRWHTTRDKATPSKPFTSPTVLARYSGTRHHICWHAVGHRTLNAVAVGVCPCPVT